MRFDNPQTFVDKLGEDWLLHGSLHADVWPLRSVQVTYHAHEMSVRQHFTNHLRLPYSHTYYCYSYQ